MSSLATALDENTPVKLRSPEKYVMRISATSKCNLDCRYCEPSGGNPNVMSDEDLLGIIQAGVKAGIDKVSWTGGEPSIRPGIAQVMAVAKGLGVNYQSMTTNGVTLGNRADEFSKAGLNSVNISIESFDRDEYKGITGTDALDKVIYSIRSAMKYFDRVKLNSVITRDNIANIIKFIDFAQEFEDDLIVRFLEVVPCDNDYAKDSTFFEDTFVSVDEMISVMEGQGDISPWEIRGNVPKSRYYKISEKKGVFGVNPNHSVGFHCDGEDCTKIRVSPQAVVSNCTTKLQFCRDFTGLSQPEKDRLMAEIVQEKMDRNYEGFRHKQKYYDFWRFGKSTPDYPGKNRPSGPAQLVQLLKRPQFL